MPNKKYTECTWCNVGWAWKSEKKYYPVCWHCGEAWPGDERANQARLVESAGNQQRSWSGYSSDTGSEGWGANVARPRRLVSPGTLVKPGQLRPGGPPPTWPEFERRPAGTTEEERDHFA